MLKKILVVAFALILASCTLLSTPEPVPTLTGDQAIQTAQAMAVLTRAAITPTASLTPVPPTPVTPSVTPTPEVSPTPTSAEARADQTANVRTGPDVVYGWIDFFFQGQTAQILGRYENSSDGTWWYLRRIGGGIDGWVWGGVVTVSGDVSGVPYLAAPASPTPGPSPTPIPTATASP